MAEDPRAGRRPAARSSRGGPADALLRHARAPGGARFWAAARNVGPILIGPAIMSAAASALLFAPTAVAYVGLIAAAVVAGRSGGTAAALAAAPVAGLWWLWAFSEPRFRARASDVTDIRLAFLLVGLCAVTAVIGQHVGTGHHVKVGHHPKIGQHVTR